MAARFSSILHDVAAVSVECYPAPSRRYQKAGRFARATCPAASPEVFASSTTAALAFARVFSGAAQTVSSRRSPFPIQGLLDPNLTPLYQGARFKSLGLDGRVGFGALMSRCVARVSSAAAHTVSSLGLLFIRVAVGQNSCHPCTPDVCMRRLYNPSHRLLVIRRAVSNPNVYLWPSAPNAQLPLNLTSAHRGPPVQIPNDPRGA